MVIPSVAEKERDKYERMWGADSYHDHSPGKRWVVVFEELAKPKERETLIDLGCGAGEGSAELQKLGLDVAGVDLDDFRDDKAPPFRAMPLWNDWSFPGRFARADYGYCCDVMEHIPPEYVMLVLERMRQNCQSLFLCISHMPDQSGKIIGETLHLTVQPFEWWRDRLADIGEVVHARDMILESIYYVKCKN